MKRLLQILCIVSIPVFLFLNVWQGYRYWYLGKEVRELERAQLELFERNKLAIAGIAFVSSPERIDKLAAGELGLVKSGSSRVIHLRSGEGGAEP